VEVTGVSKNDDGILEPPLLLSASTFPSIGATLGAKVSEGSEGVKYLDGMEVCEIVGIVGVVVVGVVGAALAGGKVVIGDKVGDNEMDALAKESPERTKKIVLIAIVVMVVSKLMRLMVL
jgi:hypothetical protein